MSQLQIFIIFHRQDVFKDDINPPEPERTDFRSVTMKDFNQPDFQHIPPPPTKVCLNLNAFFMNIHA